MIKEDSKLAKVKDKIRALLNLANDKAATEGEVAAAMNRANKLMQEYMIEIKDIDTAKEEFVCISKSFNWLHKQSITISMDNRIAKAFNCEMVFNRYHKRSTVYGTELDVDTAIYMIELAHNALNNAFARYRRTEEYAKALHIYEISKSALKNDFIKGFAFGVMKVCEDIINDNKVPEETESDNTITEVKYQMIVLKNDMVKEYMHEQNPNLKTSKSRIRGINDENAFSSGYKGGLQVRFNKGINKGSDDLQCIGQSKR